MVLSTRERVVLDVTDQGEAHRLHILRESGLLDDGPLPELDELCERARSYFDVEVALVTLVDADRQVFKAAAGTDLRETSRTVAFCDHTIRGDAVLVVPDATRDPRFAANPLVAGAPYIRFYAGAPLIYLDGVRLGSFCLIDSRPRQLSSVEEADMALTAERVVGAILEQQYERRFGATTV
ncbi:GAF domain-containing protein [Rubellimicrobium roseum]|uniref:GAF domain-containing protein n=1 Tax=Rubellimicrobium roseum TaxID=687525 RepID=A0A5C4NQG3_9RHOB|nr:GAF domain-containing protein [Rubellimicrobium roseum]TNC74917.1 GAF domain-containing protein [Rubellimicrobium roseum]